MSITAVQFQAELSMPEFFASYGTEAKCYRALYKSLNGRLRDECLNEHWFPTLLHARTEIERCRREDKENRPKN